MPSSPHPLDPVYQTTVAPREYKPTRPNVTHYQAGKIQPIDYINSQGMNFNLGCVVKYVTRCNFKGTKQEDLQKAIDYIKFEMEKEC